MATLPDTMLVIPLYNKVLLPSVVMKLTMRGRDAIALTRKHRRMSDQRKTTYLACIPLSASPEDKNATLQPSTMTELPDDMKEQQGFVKDEEKDRLYTHGCAARIVRIQRSGLGVFSVFIEGVARFHVEKYIEDTAGLIAKVSYPPAEGKEALEQAKDEIIAFKALVREFTTKMRDLQLPDTLIQQLSKLVDTLSPAVLADLMMSVIETSFDEKLFMLSTMDVKERLAKASEWMARQLHVLKISEQIHSSIEGKLSKKQREFYLRQQLEAIKQELGESDGNSGGKDEDDIGQLGRRLEEADLPKEAATVAQRELKRIKKLQPSSSEWSVLRNYLELMADLPWSKKSEEVLDIPRAKQQLEEDHFGLDHVKKRIIEYLSVIKIKGDLKAPIICFVGPPGVGKTSLGRSIAAALSREFHRVSLGGVRDEADMRGHRRTYVGAMPGLIIQGLRKCGVNNPLFLLDEIDKLVHSTHYGDPAAALLEVLDPEQNNTFSDHYLNVPFDLSNVLFIATANSLDTIPEPLLDRMELIHLNGYTFEEKLHIARSHLLPKQVRAHGLEEGQVTMEDHVLLKMAENYTRESGVRSFERTIAAVVRAKCVELADLRDQGKEDEYIAQVKLDDLESILGIAIFEKEVAERDSVPGVVTGLAYSGSGNGGILFVESTKMPGKGDLQLTGSLGEVIKESAQIALSWVKAHAHELKIAATQQVNIVEHYDVHIHVPGGAVPKDGPSAGVTLVCSLVSLFSGYYVPTTTAMTGEVSLRGQVLPVGGIKEKVISAHRAGIRKIIMPYRNRKDVEADVPDRVKEDIEFVYAKNIWDVLEAALIISDNERWTTRSYESHL
ncbi:ATP-dependent protease La [Radiomyces spectabilis]|uniref:ATP-dependent protease La n=1 Tax=Radiomyces spectabilis TaxID=64574 RepID=UPI0022205402|nr:ATP-dependent protease La [Radiomyces spectabilis]KAI8366033.1 ATP-dependent protease La [Radiomyces spectabilis]